MSWFSALVCMLATCCVPDAASNASSPTSEPRRLTDDGLAKTSPVFVDRSGSELLYVVEDTATRMRLMRMKLSDRTTTPLHPDETRSEFEPACSPDGRLLAFVQSRGNLNLVVVIQELGSKRETSINLGGGFAGPRSPTFTADGARVVYSFADEGRQHLYVVGAEGGEPKKLVDSSGVNNWPVATPDGKRMVFGSSRDADFELYTSDLDGANPKRLTHSPGQDIRPRVSPDGRWIAFTSNRDGNYELYVMNFDGSDVRRITNHPERDDYATWHPDGRRLIFVGERAGRHDLYEIDVP